MCCDSPSPPSNEPLRAASDYATNVGRELGTAQIAEGRRQYDNNMRVAQPVIDAQLGIMNDTRAQAADYYTYGQRGRPVEASLNAESMVDTSGRDAAERNAILDRINSNAAQDVTGRAGMMRLSDENAAADVAERNLITGGDQGVYDVRRADIEGSVGRAAADARQGLTSQYNQLLRQGMRYGYSPQAMARRFGSQATAAGLGVASAANQARQSGIERAREMMGVGYDMRNATYGRQDTALGRDYDLRNQTAATEVAGLNADRNIGIQDRAIGWGRKLDVAGLYRNMPGASQGAYGLALGAGNNAVSNQMAPGQQYQTAMGQGTGTIQTGAGQGLQGQIASYNGAISAFNTEANQPSTLGTLIGAGTTLGAAKLMSDRRLKKDIVLVGRDERTGLNLYEFSYVEGGKRRYRGAMADEVLKVMPEAVTYWAGYAAVDYGKLGFNMVEVSHGR